MSQYLDVLNALPTTRQIKRELTTGAKAGLGIGIAVAIIIVGLIITFFVIHVRRRAHSQSIDREQAIVAGEKNVDGGDKINKLTSEPTVSTIPRRKKSVKDRLMGPLYRGSVIDLPAMPSRARNAGGSNRQSTLTLGDGDSSVSKPWTNNENSPRASYSSKRATRMMMMM